MRTCIFGGAGFIGKNLAIHLADMGRDLTVVGRSKSPLKALPTGIRYQHYLQTGPEALAKIVAGCDEVIDLAYATVPRTSFADPVYDIQANLPFSVQLLQVAQSMGVGRTVIVSSGGAVYGASGYLPISETHPTVPLSPYGITKLTIEKFALMFYHCYNLPVVVVRPANAYGSDQDPHRGQGFVAAAIARIAAGEEISIFGSRGTVRDYIHVSDVVSGIVAALILGEPGEIYNIGTGVGHDNIEVVETICRVANIPVSTVSLRLLAPRPFDVPTNVLDSGKLCRQTGWKPHVPFVDGIAMCWNEFLIQKGH
jgi:UDP-glucose 4-epimerase